MTLSLHAGQQIELTIEKPAAGGWMIARHHGQVVLVRGAIPGERVTAWVDRADKRLAYAVTRDVIEASADRRDGGPDPLCGGALYSHIAYPRQLVLKSEIVRDAFARIGRHPLESDVPVEGSREDAYRMRARFHVQGSRVGFYREGTHAICDASLTRQVLPATLETARSIAETMGAAGPLAVSISENIAGSERAAHVECPAGARLDESLLETARERAAVTGISAARGDMPGGLLAGEPVVGDPLSAITGLKVEGEIRRHAASFFQGNRYLLAPLVAAVTGLVPDDGAVLELYAGVGLFAASLAAAGHIEVTAVEGDRTSGADLRRNAQSYAPRVRAEIARVEDYLRAWKGSPARTLLVDPPRTGLSPEAVDLILRHQAPTVVYVSCDPPTLARDVRRLADGGYRLDAIRAFDLFPNTPHVETVVRFGRQA